MFCFRSFTGTSSITNSLLINEIYEAKKVLFDTFVVLCTTLMTKYLAQCNKMLSFHGYHKPTEDVRNICILCIVAYLLKAGSVKPAEKAVTE
jgi:hypothetical protein